MHEYHGAVVDNLNNPVFPPGATVEESCYQCHPGSITQCQQGAMKTGGLACEACHGSTHAIWPNADLSSNDNIASRQLQGHAGTIIECAACHATGSLPLTINGPHGLHNVNDPRWIDEEHGEIYARNKNNCKACHGMDLRGTALAKTAAARTFRVEDEGTVDLAAGEPVSCNRCHEMPRL
jgi:hypothetical protein